MVCPTAPTLPITLEKIQRNCTLVYAGEDLEVPGKDSSNAFPSVCFCVVFIKTLMPEQLWREKVAALSILHVL